MPIVTDVEWLLRRRRELNAAHKRWRAAIRDRDMEADREAVRDMAAAARALLRVQDFRLSSELRDAWS